MRAYRASFLDAMRDAGIDALLTVPYATPPLPHGMSKNFVMAGSPAMLFNMLQLPACIVPVSTVRASETERSSILGLLDRHAAKVDRKSAGLPLSVQIAGRPWDEASVLTRTLSAQELLTLEPREILRRLFHEFDLRLFDERGPQFRCTCSRERVADMLRMLGRAEVEDIVAEQGRVAVDCEFCSQNYAFDAAQAAALFGTGGTGNTPLRH
jgi:hypothetical protein